MPNLGVIVLSVPGDEVRLATDAMRRAGEGGGPPDWRRSCN